jgi:hypothetical protein
MPESMLQGAVGMELGLVLLKQMDSQLFIAKTNSNDTSLQLAGSASTSFFCHIACF